MKTRRINQLLHALRENDAALDATSPEPDQTNILLIHREELIKELRELVLKNPLCWLN